MERVVQVFMDAPGGATPVGRLWARSRQGIESATFMYDAAWLARADRFALEPALPLTAGPHHTPHGKALFGALGDSAPDRWGRELMRRSVRRDALAGGSPRTLLEIDYLLRVSDFGRLGALRFASVDGGTFLAPDDAAPIPPLVELPALLNASDEVLDNTESDSLRILLAPGSSLGGARPKALVRDVDGELAIAKFPAHSDEVSVVRWEAVALRLAEEAGIAVPSRRLETIHGRPVLLLRRFDRGTNGRIPFLSAMAALSANDHETNGYPEFVDFLRQHGTTPKADCAALWRRIVFNVLVSNTDDHLRNHGFLHGPGGWTLSPAYDLNPTPTDQKPRLLSTAIDFHDVTASLKLAFDVAPYFDLSDAAARRIAAEVAQATAKWRAAAMELGIAGAEIKRMESAFEHADLELALALKAPHGPP